jgi:hypothetical protein
MALIRLHAAVSPSRRKTTVNQLFGRGGRLKMRLAVGVPEKIGYQALVRHSPRLRIRLIRFLPAQEAGIYRISTKTQSTLLITQPTLFDSGMVEPRSNTDGQGKKL